MARGDAKAAGRTLGSLLHSAATSPAAMFTARLLVRGQQGLLLLLLRRCCVSMDCVQALVQLAFAAAIL